MTINPADFPEEGGGATYPEEARGWQRMKLNKFRAEAKGDRVWFLLELGNEESGARASASLNIFTAPETDGKKKANQISMGVFKSLWQAAGLPESEYPAPNPREIVKALNSYEDKLVVDAFCGPDGRGYTQATKFRKATDAEGV